MSMQTEVVNAAKLLDKEVPGWHKKVKRNKLVMDMASACILGQLFGHAFDSTNIPSKLKNLKALGMDKNNVYMNRDEQIEKLTDLWKLEIKKRRD